MRGGMRLMSATQLLCTRAATACSIALARAYVGKAALEMVEEEGEAEAEEGGREAEGICVMQRVKRQW
jgi:hypothetical protein